MTSQLSAQVGTFDVLQLTNNYTNTITTVLQTANNRSGFVHQSNGSFNFGLTGAKANKFRYRWLAHDNGAVDYTTDTDMIMFLDADGNQYLKGNVGIGTAPTAERLSIDMGATRGAVNMISDGDAIVYTDLKYSIKNTTNVPADKPIIWVSSMRKDGYFTGDVSGATLESYAVRKGGGYYAPLLFKSNGDLILAGAKNAINGNVAIGTTDTKGYKLAVNGDAMFTRIKVKSYEAWPDYVFDEQYQLPSLHDVEQYIKTNRHLPDMPAAAEVKKEGMDVEEMNRKLLQKVEELTLYIIQQEKRLQELEAAAQKNNNLDQ
jgi:hypothetical protein